MSLDHDFLLLPEGKVNYTDYGNYFCSPADVRLHDDFIRYPEVLRVNKETKN